MPGTHSGYGYPRTLVTYEAINIVRQSVLALDLFINTKRGQPGQSREFFGMLPPQVQQIAQPTGCYSLPDATCMTSYTFDGKINKSRYINEKSDPCDWAIMEARGGEYLAMTSQAWADDEAKNVFNYVKSITTSTEAVTALTIKEDIEDMIDQVEEESYKQLGAFASDRSDLVILVSTKVESALRKLNFPCCALADVLKQPLTNVFEVKALVKLPRKYMPADVDVIVYDPRWGYEMTQCESGVLVQDLNDEHNKPGTKRVYAWEDYGFDRHKFPNADKSALVDVFVGVHAVMTEAASAGRMSAPMSQPTALSDEVNDEAFGDVDTPVETETNVPTKSKTK